MSSITQSSESLTLAGAKIAIAAAEAKAREMGLGMNIAVVDASVRSSFTSLVPYHYVAPQLSSFGVGVPLLRGEVGTWDVNMRGS
jgi:hypothetical protein